MTDNENNLKASQYATIFRELDWYYNQFDACIGFRSNMASVESRLNGVTPALITDPYTDKIMQNVRKCQAIRQKLNSLPVLLRRVLDATYYKEYMFPHEITYKFGKKSGAALISCTIPLPDLIRLVKKKYQKSLSPEEHKLSFTIQREADDLYKLAHIAFWNSK